MSGETTEIVHRFSIDGPLDQWSAVGIGILCATFFAWLLWSQRRATGPAWAAGFWLLRVVAMGLVLWMLLDPGWVTQHRTTKPQSIAVLVDTSDSMGVTDPLAGARQLRWVQAASGADDANALTLCDQASVCVGIALRRIQTSRQAIAHHQARKEIQQHLISVSDAVVRGSEHLTIALESHQVSAAEVGGKIKRILSRMQGSIQHDLRDLNQIMDQSDVSQSSDAIESLIAIEDALDQVERRLHELSGNLEQAVEGSAGGTSRKESIGASRKEYVSRTLTNVQQTVEDSASDTVSIRPIRFAEHAAAASLDSGWSSVLQTHKESASSQEEPRSGGLTDISLALEQLGRTATAESIRAAVLITDGVHNTPHAAAPQEIAATLGDIPVHVIPIGQTEVLRDALLHRVDAPTAVVENDTILIDVIVTASRCAGESTALTLQQNGKTVDEQILTFNTERNDQRVYFRVAADQLGHHEFKLFLEPLDDEASETNNVNEFTVNVVNDSLRVLLVDRIARWEYRYLEQLFRRDESITFEKLLFYPEVRATGRIAETGALPRDAEGWSHYDVVILGDLEPAQLDTDVQKSLEEFVRVRGGHLVAIAGPEYMPDRFDRQPLLNLLPVEKGRPLKAPDGLPVTLTSSGRNHPAFLIADSAEQSEAAWKKQFEFLPLYSISRYSSPKPAAETLMSVESGNSAVSVTGASGRTTSHALACWHQAGAGRVVYLSAPATYRLRYRRGDRYHHRFWGQLLRWLTAAERGSGTQTVRIDTDSVHYQSGEPVEVTVRLSALDGSPISEKNVRAQAIPERGSPVIIDLSADTNIPGLYTGSFAALKSGAYRVVPAGAIIDELLPQAEEKQLAEAQITMLGADNPELLNTHCNVALLRQIAEVTGGQVVPPTALGELLTLSSMAAEVSERTEREPLWTRWSLLVTAFVCLSTEWVVRKRLGLV